MRARETALSGTWSLVGPRLNQSVSLVRRRQGAGARQADGCRHESGRGEVVSVGSVSGNSCRTHRISSEKGRVSFGLESCSSDDDAGFSSRVFPSRSAAVRSSLSFLDAAKARSVGVDEVLGHSGGVEGTEQPLTVPSLGDNEEGGDLCRGVVSSAQLAAVDEGTAVIAGGGPENGSVSRGCLLDTLKSLLGDQDLSHKRELLGHCDGTRDSCFRWLSFGMGVGTCAVSFRVCLALLSHIHCPSLFASTRTLTKLPLGQRTAPVA